MIERIPAEPPIDGPFWTVIVPAMLLILSAAATVLLYRHFAAKRTDDS